MIHTSGYTKNFFKINYLQTLAVGFLYSFYTPLPSGSLLFWYNQGRGKVTESVVLPWLQHCRLVVVFVGILLRGCLVHCLCDKYDCGMG